MDLARRNITLVHLSTPSQFIEWLKGHPPDKEVLFLMDFELLGSQETGLDLIQSLRIERRSILVTSRYEERSVRERCQSLQVKLIPKTMAGFVPIAVQSAEAILIDDDPIVHRMWKNKADRVGKRLISFSNVNDFLVHCGDFDPETPVYLDSNLGDGVRGETLAPKIRARGFSEIYLVTGFSPGSFPAKPEIKAILDKSPPWG